MSLVCCEIVIKIATDVYNNHTRRVYFTQCHAMQCHENTSDFLAQHLMDALVLRADKISLIHKKFSIEIKLAGTQKK